jgi:hypothetical protein
LSTNETPEGKPPTSVIEGVGYPVAVTVNEPVELTENVAVFALENEGDWFTVKVKL